MNPISDARRAGGTPRPGRALAAATGLWLALVAAGPVQAQAPSGHRWMDMPTFGARCNIDSIASHAEGWADSNQARYLVLADCSRVDADVLTLSLMRGRRAGQDVTLAEVGLGKAPLLRDARGQRGLRALDRASALLAEVRPTPPAKLVVDGANRVLNSSARYTIDGKDYSAAQGVVMGLARLGEADAAGRLALEAWLAQAGERLGSQLAGLPEGPWSRLTQPMAAASADRESAQQKVSVADYFNRIGAAGPDWAGLRAAFRQVPAMAPDSACAQKLANGLAAAAQPLGTLLGAQEWGASIGQPQALLALMRTPDPAPPPPDRRSTPRSRGLGVLTDAACNTAWLEFRLKGQYTSGQRYEETAYARLAWGEHSASHGRRELTHAWWRSEAFVDSTRVSQRHEPDQAMVCTPGRCITGTLAEAFAISPAEFRAGDDWPAAMKTELAQLERQRSELERQRADARARAEAERQAAERQQAQARQAAAERERLEQEAHERRLAEALNARDGQTMYLAAGRFQREGRSQAAREVYQRLIERFASTPWAVKANDQLLAEQRVDQANAAIDRAGREAGARAVQQCEIEVRACYNRGGQSCARDCAALR